MSNVWPKSTLDTGLWFVFGDMCEDWLQHQQDRVDTDRITRERLIRGTQVRRWIVPYIGKREKSAVWIETHSMTTECSGVATGNQVEDVTIRNEYTTKCDSEMGIQARHPSI